MPITYIRLLKFLLSDVPKDPSSTRATCAITLTSDLGDSSYPDAVPITLKLTSSRGSQESKIQWTGTHAVQKFEVQVDLTAIFGNKKPDQETCYTVSINATSTKKRKHQEFHKTASPSSCDYLHRFITSSQDYFILGLTAHCQFGRPFNQSGDRSFSMGKKTYAIRESTTESIMSHVWDAGVVLSALITYPSAPFVFPEFQKRLSRTIAASKTVVELGTGIGLLGISMGVRYPHLSITVTDLMMAKELVETNISSCGAQNVHFEPLDWTMPSSTIQSGMDLLVMSDVTYNESYHDALFETIRSLINERTTILFASKYRHISERVFIQRLSKAYSVIEAVTVNGSTFVGNSIGAEAGIGDVEILVFSSG